MNKSNLNLTDTRDFVLWRYMDFAKFVDILINRKLYFHFASKQSDQYEGRARETNSDPRVQSFVDFTRNSYGLNCWHKSDHESLLMWKAYCTRDAGVAIKSTRAAVHKAIGENRYVSYLDADYGLENKLDGTTLNLLKFKRPEYKGENEYRVIARHVTEISALPDDFKEYKVLTSKTANGFKINVNPAVLIHSVYVNAGASWLKEIIEDLCVVHQFTFPVLVSEIS